LFPGINNKHEDNLLFRLGATKLKSYLQGVKIINIALTKLGRVFREGKTGVGSTGFEPVTS
jgi:hypothetical protein